MVILMKRLIFKLSLIFVLLIVYSAKAQENSAPYETDTKKDQEKQNWLIPRYAKIQYAGSMGLVSVGVGWEYGKKDQWETDFMIGYVPKYTTDRAKVCVTLKENYTPWKLRTRNQNLYMEPLTCGLYVNTILDDDFWVKTPKKYPGPYYSFSTKVRLNIYIGQRMTYEINPNKGQHSKSISAFYEISSNDLYIVSALGNRKYFHPSDYLRLSFGVKMQWF